MPWHIGQAEGCDGIAVIKDSDSSIAGCHETREEAAAQMAALYASEGDVTESNVNQARNLIEQALELLNEDGEPMAELEISEFAEFSRGHVLAIEEAEIKTDKIVPMTLDVVLIEPGPGNAKDGHYYPAEVLRRDAGVFKDAKMFATDHRQEEKNIGTWVSTIKNCPVGFTETGGPIARVIVHKAWFAEDILPLQESGLLQRMECSIIGEGKAKKGKIGETEYSIVEAITKGGADWVTQAGAGGRALAIAESDAPAPDGGTDMDEKEKEVVQEAETVILREEDGNEQSPEPEVEIEGQESATEEEQEEDAPMPEATVTELLKEAGLGTDAITWVGARLYKNEQELNEAVGAFKALIKKASGSGQPFAHGKTEPVQQTVKERAKEDAVKFDEMMASLGSTRSYMPAQFKE